MIVNVKGLDRAELLAALYNATHAVGLGVRDDLRRDMTVAEARQRLHERRSELGPLRRHGLLATFDWVAGRPIKCDVDQDEIDFDVYDNVAGPGTGARVVQQLREKQR